MSFWLDDKRNLIVYPGNPGPLAQYIPDLKLVNGSYFCFPKTLQNLQVAAWQNWPVPFVLTDDNYDFPTEPGKKALPHQKLYANFLLLHPRCWNLGDAGSMKTLPTLWAIEFLKRHTKEPFKALVTAPLSILETGWGAAIYRNFLNRLSFEILIGDADKRTKKLEKDVDIYIINHDGLKVGAHIRRKVDVRRPNQKKVELDGFSKALAEKSDIKAVVIDEAHNFSDAQTARHHCARMIFGQKPIMWQLTGTPTPQRPTDAYGMAKLLNNAYGKSFSGFRLETMIRVSDFKWIPQKEGYDRARRLLTPAIRFALDEVWAGPEMAYKRVKVELTSDQKKELTRLKSSLQVIAGSGKAIDAANESAARQKLIQLSLGAIYDSEHNVHLIDATPRYKELERLIESTQRKVVVFAPITSVIHLIVKFLRDTWKKRDIEWTCDFINGEVDAKKERPGIIRRFQDDPAFKVIVADPVAASEGINEFVVADTVVWFGAVDKSRAWTQGNARVRRPGQKYPSVCYQIVSNKLEEEIFNRLENNTSMQGIMLAAIRNGDI